MVRLGIISCPMPLKHLDPATSYVYQSYLNWVGLAATPLIIPYDTTDLTPYLQSIDGLVWVGGGIENKVTHSDKQFKVMMATYERAYNHAVEENEAGRPFPIFGICLGFYLLALLGEEVHHDFFSKQRVQRVPKFSQGSLRFVGESKLKRLFSPKELKSFATTKVTNHLHTYGFAADSPHTKGLDHLAITSYETSDDGRQFVNMYEFKKYPFYGIQWHPDRPLTDNAVVLSRKLSLFLASLCTSRPMAPSLLKRATSKVLIS
jgi:gamma-glutamyl hydrolase